MEWKSEITELSKIAIEGILEDKAKELSNKIEKSLKKANTVLETENNFVESHKNFTKGFQDGFKIGKLGSMIVIGFGILVVIFAIWTVKKETDFDRYNARIQKSAEVAEQNNKILEQIVDINSGNLSKYVNCYFSGFRAEKLYYWTVYNNSHEKLTLSKNFNSWLKGYESFDQNKWLDTLNEDDKINLKENMRNLGIIEKKVGDYMKQLDNKATFGEKAWAFMKDYRYPIIIIVFLIIGFLLGGYCQENRKLTIWR